MTQTVILRGLEQRALACSLIERAPADSVVKISGPKRTRDQNALMWALLSDLSRAKPDGRMHTPETWKDLCMHACGHAVRFEVGLNNEPFPVGFRSSNLTRAQMSDLIDFIYSYGTERGVKWTDNEWRAA